MMKDYGKSLASWVFHKEYCEVEDENHLRLILGSDGRYFMFFQNCIFYFLFGLQFHKYTNFALHAIFYIHWI